MKNKYITTLERLIEWYPNCPLCKKPLTYFSKYSRFNISNSKWEINLVKYKLDGSNLLSDYGDISPKSFIIKKDDGYYNKYTHLSKSCRTCQVRSESVISHLPKIESFTVIASTIGDTKVFFSKDRVSLFRFKSKRIIIDDDPWNLSKAELFYIARKHLNREILK